MLFPCKTIEEIPDVFMYLTSDKKHVCFKRFKAKDISDVLGDDDFWKMSGDTAINVVTNDWESGYIHERTLYE